MKKVFNILVITLLVIALIVSGGSDSDSSEELENSVVKDGVAILKFAIQADGPWEVARKLNSENFIKITPTSGGKATTEITVTIKDTPYSYAETITFGEYMEVHFLSNYLVTDRYYISMYGRFSRRYSDGGLCGKRQNYPLLIGDFDKDNRARAEFLCSNLF